MDELIYHEGQYLPVDYKLARKEGEHFRVQLAAYAMMVEEHYQQPVHEGLLYLILARKTVRIRITSQLRKKVQTLVLQMHHIAATEHMPAPPDSRRQCVECEFRRFCNDVL
jgi:CRISPR-associated exonuclease Cas4